MANKRCENGHYYDPDKNISCPHCGVPGLNIDPTIIKGASAERHDTEGQTVAQDARPGGAHNQNAIDPTATVAVMPRKLGIDPVVGWLVCIEGADKGRDFRIKAEKNFIGRDPSMDVCIPGDQGISRVKHAVINFDNRTSSYLLLPGEAHGNVYHNGSVVLGPQPLNPYDVIEIAQTKLVFIPFCGEKFTW
ncbi:MAG: FHA domain-containing protein [Gammaproteobacteria bacterium]|nr:FHA domain-containing protein [Gammaproteobacteria bacterium]